MRLPSVTRRPLSPEPLQRVPWEELGPEFHANWGYPGGRFDPQHLSVYGKSGVGKTYAVARILQERAEYRESHIVMVATKPADRTMVNTGWPIERTWPPGYGKKQVIFWPPGNGMTPEGLEKQRKAVEGFMAANWRKDANIVIFWDELTYVEQDLGLARPVRTFYREGRSMGITNVATMQRPAGVSRLAHSMAGWTIAFPAKDVDDRKRVAEVLGDRARFMAAQEDLDATKREFILRDDRTGEAYITHMPRRKRNAEPQNIYEASRTDVRSPQR